MNRFEEFMATGDVRRQAPDSRLSGNTVKSGQERLALAKRLLKQDDPRFALENAYEALREVIDGILYGRGYKSYSHEASVAYLTDLNVDEKAVTDIQLLRRHRNKIKYYGGTATAQEAKRAVEICERIIRKILEKRGAR